MKRLLPPLIIALAALLVGFAGNGSRLPLDDHEVFVARTAEEMLQRGSVIVPYLNGEPRTAKPPLAYWVTMLVDRLGDRDGFITEWEARVPTIIGGVLWALAALALGTILCGPTVGFVGALLLVGGTGFHSYTHSARPELLYAMFCTAGLACFARQWRMTGGPGGPPTPGPRSFIWPALGWAVMGLAILTKGPQLPLIMLAAWAIGMAAMGERRAILRTLRPFSGIAIAAAVALWWFIIMWTGVEGAGDRMGRETIGRILQVEGKPLTRVIDPYYFYRIAVLLVPWVALYVAALASPWIKEIKLPRGSRLLWWISIITMASLHLTFNRRWYYLLPMLAPLSALMAWTILAIGQALVDRGRVWAWRVIVLLHIAAAPAILGYLWQRKPEFLQPTYLTMAILVAIALIGGVALIAHTRARESVTRGATIMALLGVSLMACAGLRDTLWNVERYRRRDFAHEVGRSLPPDAILFGNQSDWAQEQYYLHRTIPSFNRRSDLIDALRESAKRGVTCLLTNSRKPLEPIPGIDMHPLVQRDVERGETLTLWRIAPR